MGLQNMINKAATSQAKGAVDQALGTAGSDPDEKEADEDGETRLGRTKGLWKKLGDRVRARSSSSSSNDETPNGPKKKPNKGKTPKKGSDASSGGAHSGPESADSGQPKFEVTDTETPVESADSDTGEGATTNSGGAESRAGSDWQTDSTASDQSQLEEAKRKAIDKEETRLRNMRPDEAVAYNPKASTEFTVKVRVIEAKELQGENLNPLVRVSLAGKTRTTRSIKGTDSPFWNQTLGFTIKSSIEDLAMLNCEFNVYSARRLIRDSLIGAFNMNMGVVYKNKNQAVVEKWLALMPGRIEEEAGGQATEIRGFLKISICVFHANQIPPSLVRRGAKGDADGDEDVLFRAQLLNYCLRMRIFKVSQLADHVRYPHKSAPKAPGMVAVEVAVGPYHCTTSFESADDESISFGEELQIPIMWPTVIKQVRFRLIILNQRKKKRVLCTEFVSLRDMCQPGERGFLPNFGPAYISFYGPEQRRSTWKQWEKNQIKDGQYQGSHFCGRLYFELSCDESGLSKTHVVSIPTAMVQTAENFYRQERYALFCSFFAANLIHSDFKSKNIHFVVSIGEFGSDDYGDVCTCTNRTLPVMPAYDTTHLYAMPWGNQKPVCELQCDWENIQWRFDVTNLLNKTADLLQECLEEASIKAGSNPEQSELASLVVEAIEEAADCFESLHRTIKHYQASSESLTALDILLQNARLDSLYRFYKQIADFKFRKQDLVELDDIAIHQLGVFSQQLRELAADPQLSVPDMCIHMMVDNQVVGHARVPVNEIHYAKSALRSGRFTGKINAIPLLWPTAQMTRFRGHELPAVIHIKAWFGLVKYRDVWLQQIKPADMKYYAEIFYNQNRPLLKTEFVDSKKNPPTISDESGRIECSESAVHEPAGWRFRGKWTPMRSHDMWVGADAGHETFEDEFFEVEQKDAVTQCWSFSARTSFYGETVDAKDVESPPPGWVYESGWSIDLHCPGDADGWQYSAAPEFWEQPPGAADTVERQTHRFRRRRHKRRRRFAAADVGVTEMFEDLRVFAKNLDEEGWEFASRFGQPVHLLQQTGDRFRRRRLVRELQPVGDANQYKLEMGVLFDKTKTDSVCFLSPRIYEVHDQVSLFQLRVYVLWAREVHSPKKHLSRAFVRVFFLNRCQQTHIVGNSLNPIWNETLIYNRILIPGGALTLQSNPPSAVVEMHGEEVNGKPVFLGRFDLKPTVINCHTDSRSTANWNALKHSKDRIKGALLMHMELFQNDPALRPLVPIEPAKKENLHNRYEVPPDVRPAFTNFTVQIMAWGVRNLARHQLLSVRSPYVAFTVADRKDITDTIEDTALNPNFARPLLTFSAVQMPAELCYAPPIVLSLHDRRSFGRQPLIGSCIVKSFQKYLTAPPPLRDSKRLEVEWENFDRGLAAEVKLQLEEARALKKTQPEEYLAFPDDPNSPRIDWWSKYYFSKGVLEQAPGYGELGLGKLQIYKVPLEDVGEYRGFEDFLDTFIFTKPFGNRLDAQADKKGELKGKLFITRHDDQNLVQLSPTGVEFDGPVECVVRVYVVGASGLVSRRRSGLCDPYVNIRCGNKKKFKGHKDYRPDTLEPTFGQCVEMEVTIPQEKDLVVSVMDKRLMMSDNEIGSTTIDLENRLLTKYRATVGLPKHYEVIGPLPWRDQLTPLQILRRYCQKMNLPPPKLLRNEQGDAGLEWADVQFWSRDLDKVDPARNEFAGRAQHRLALHVLHRIGLVPEHVETRPLYHSVNPEMECGQLELFVDVLPKVITDRIPPPVDIQPRQPKAFQLRVVVWGLRNVILPKTSFGRPAADLYVRCYLNGMAKSEKTDIHYRCLDGAASFNWRFVFDFDYDVFQRRIQAYRKNRWFRKRSADLVDPFLIIQIWDNNKFKQDRYIGQCQLDLLAFEEPLLDEDEIEAVGYEREPDGCTCCTVCTSGCVLCVRTRCCTRMPARKKKLVKMPRAPRYVPNATSDMSLFQQRTVSGFWPCTATNLPPQQRADYDERAKKHDNGESGDAQPPPGDNDAPPDDSNANVEYVTGLVEMELNLMPMEEALGHPVGKKRNKPNHSPHLPAPDRPKFNSFWCTSRTKALCRICWHKTGGWSCVWLVVCAILLTLLVVAFIYQLPNILSDATLRILFGR